GPPSFRSFLMDAATPASNGSYFVGLDARLVASRSTAATSSPARTTAPVATSRSLASERETATVHGVPPNVSDPRFVVDQPHRPRFPPVDLFEYQGKQLFARYGIPV